MAIHYDIYPCTGIAKKEEKYYVKFSNDGVIDLKKMQNDAAEISTVSEPDFGAVIPALCEQMANCMLDGHSVHVNGLGYFSVAPTGDVEKNKSGNLVMKNGHIREIKFRPDKEFLARFFAPQFKQVSLPGSHSAKVTEEKIQQAITELLDKYKYVSVESFATTLNLNWKLATKLLKKEVEEGTLVDCGPKSMYQFVRP